MWDGLMFEHLKELSKTTARFFSALLSVLETDQILLVNNTIKTRYTNRVDKEPIR